MSQEQHILAVDDELAAKELFGDYLRMHGFKVTRCDGGNNARQVLEQQAVDLVVLDLNMPQEDGLSIIRYLKQRTNIPVIMLTATASAIDRVVSLELGADDYLARPCELRELLARIRSVLRRSAAATPPVASTTAGTRTDNSRLVHFGTKWLDLDGQVLRDAEGNEHPLDGLKIRDLKGVRRQS